MPLPDKVAYVSDGSSLVFLATNFKVVAKSGRSSGCAGGRMASSGLSALSSGAPVDFDVLFDVLLADSLPFFDLFDLS